MITRSLSLLICALAVGCGNHAASPAASVAAGATSGGTQTANFQPVGFETLDVGADSPRGAALGAHEVHVATDADWTALWATHSQAPRPAVDFAREAVVGTFMGQLTTGGHATRVVGVARDRNSDDLRARVREFRLAPWKPQPSVLTSPFHLVRCATAVSGQGSLTVDRQTLLDFEPLAAGTDSALGAGDPTYTGGLYVLRDAASFASFFARIQPSAGVPVVDFQQAMVVAVLGPYVGSFGNSVETLRILHDARSDELRVISRVNGYRGGAAPPPATETPFQLLRVVRASGPIRAERQAPVALTALAQGRTALYAGPAEALVVRDAATFATLWANRIGGAAPAVDFTQDQVLIAFESAATGATVSVARSALLEDGELSVTVNAALLFGGSGAGYSAVTTPRTFGPVAFETIDTTPRP